MPKNIEQGEHFLNISVLLYNKIQDFYDETFFVPRGSEWLDITLSLENFSSKRESYYY